MNGPMMKARKVVWFPLIRVVGKLHPRSGTKLAIRFYTRSGMHVVGEPTFIAADAWFDGSLAYDLITLHEGCNISSGVRILTHDWSPYCTFRSLGRASKSPVGRLLPVVVGPHAFVGMGVTLMPGATIGRGAIVGAGAVVRGTVPEYAITIGNPAEVVGDSREYVSRKFPEEWEALQQVPLR